MPTVQIAAGYTSANVFVPVGSIVTVSLGVTVEYTTDSGTAVRDRQASWTALVTPVLTQDAMWVRGTATMGAGSLTIDDRPTARTLATYRQDYIKPVSLSALMPNFTEGFRQGRGGLHSIGLLYGDSTTAGYEGTYADTKIDSISNTIARVLRRSGVTVNTCNFMGTQNIGANPAVYDPRIALGPFTIVNMGAIGRAALIQNTNDAAAFSFKCDQAVDTCTMYYLSDPGGSNGTMTLDIGGSALATVDCALARAIRKTTVSLGATGFHTINVKRATNGPIYLMGLVCWNSRDPGVSLVNGGWGTATVADFASVVDPWTPANSVATIAPAFVGISLLINNWIAATNIATFTASTTSLITACKNGGASDVFLWSGPQSDASQAALATQANYLNAYQALAAGRSVPYIDCSGVIGANATANTNYSDTVGHLTRKGYALLGETIGTSLLTAIL